MMTVNVAWNIWNFRRPLVEALISDGHRVTVLAPPDDTVSNLKSIGCIFLPLDINAKGLNPIEGLTLRKRFKYMFLKEQPDVVLSYTIKNNLFGAMAARSANIPFIPNVTGLGTAFLSGGVLQTAAEVLYRQAFHASPVVFFQNEDDRDLFVDRRLVKTNQTHLLPGSGIDLTRFAVAAMPPAEEAPVFLMIARLLRDKGVVEFVDAARIVKSSFPKARFQLLGATGSENRTAIDETTVKSWVAEGVVEYLGRTTDVRPAITAATCVVLPSYREGAPRTLIEAASMARPLIATDVPGCNAVVDHDVSGYLCDVRSASSLAEALERFLSLAPEAQGEMGRAGRTKMEHEFDQALVVEAYRKAIELVNELDVCKVDVSFETIKGDKYIDYR